MVRDFYFVIAKLFSLFPQPPTTTTFTRKPFRCDTRCEVLFLGTPQAYPVSGFYCPLHSHQKSKLDFGVYLTPPDPTLESHLTRRTSYVSPERHLGVEMLKVPDLRGTVKNGIKGGSIVDWLVEKKSLKEDALAPTLGRMLEQGVLVPCDPKAQGPFKKNAEYRVIDTFKVPK